MDKIQVVILTGLSGAGKTNAVDWFEDSGFYCVDNMPPSLIKNFIELTISSPKMITKAAFVVDVRGGEFFDDMKECIADLRSDARIECSVLFIEASDRTLVKRYNETRRNHPLAIGPTTREVIQTERDRLKEIRHMSDFIIDTTSMKVADLKMEIGRIFGGGDSSFSINVTSFGYKHGLPTEADLVFDMRFIPNPYYVPSLKHLTGRNKKVSKYVLKHQAAREFSASVLGMLNKLTPLYAKEGKYHLNIAFGCTGGQHRSVAMAENMAELLKSEGYRVTLEHRDI